MNRICETCGQEYQTSRLWKSTHSCSKECAKIRKSQKAKEYWQKYKDNRNSEIREPRADHIKTRYDKKKYENNLVMMAKAAADRGMTYGEYQTMNYCQAHPLIERRRTR